MNISGDASEILAHLFVNLRTRCVCASPQQHLDVYKRSLTFSLSMPPNYWYPLTDSFICKMSLPSSCTNHEVQENGQHKQIYIVRDLGGDE